MKRFPTAAVAAALALGATPLLADTALILGNGDYDAGPAVPAAGEALDASGALQQAGFLVVSGEDLDADEMRDRLARFAGTDDAGPVAIVLSGRFANDGANTWFLGTAADQPSLATVGGAGLDLDVVLAIAAQRPGRAAVLLGAGEDETGPGDGLSSGLGELDVPQGVTVISGTPEAIAGFAGDGLTTRGRSLAALAGDDDALTAEGFLGDMAFLAERPSETDGAERSGKPRRGERGFWRASKAADTAAAYRRYLDRYPDGRFADKAQSRLDAMQTGTESGSDAESESAAQSPAESRESALGLSRSDRQKVQQNLTVLDYDTNGTEGIFGPGTRSAIERWQRDENVEATGYLTRDQIATLERQAGDRRAAREADDRSFWQETGAAGDEAGLRAYLERYPQGVFAGVAQDRLDEIEAAQNSEAANAEQSAWNEAENAGTVEGYRGYLDQYPKGDFAQEARARIADLEAPADEQNAAAEAEAKLGLSRTARNLAEKRLASLGLDPGPVDGQFDADTRDAIKSYQRDAGLEITGYLNRATVNQMLAGTALGILQ